ncbi:NAD(P)H-hydrate epimerase [Rhodobacteraceae bacterium HSP-20]|uniref:Bifunctional NAD(P)H-hydrate repair enzyme n=1 Tax=Paragemmobacter amnigenus TaxID=2852097 RepID=A0ABS6J6S9_9RHOB|nr:NAD(P)H-hydrate epimerase [Rhodobacter amnigenus]MBU9699469.1 NAD(P)H-hydrate epimerase [Rhodobacter amnigenus]MBV4390696.1 NAD(P)H-hydrate epimerase [Rhodobacter amnigenus]
MAELLTSAQMRAIEAAAIASGAVTGLELMERAGRGVVEAIFEEWPELAAGSFRAVVLCGPGNNGGDGFVVARLLKEWGWEVTCYAWDDLARQGPDARAMRAQWEAAGGVITPFVTFHPARDGFDVMVDALFGIGMTRGLEVSALNEEFLGCAPRRVAVDVPSGLMADTGQSVEPRYVAELTVTFHAPKLGHFLGVGPECCGKLVVADIGLKGGGGVPLVGPPEGLRLGKRQGAHKFGNGAALVLGGPVGRGGAARLAARGALRMGAGLVTVGCPGEALGENAARLDAVMLRVVEDGAGLAVVLEDGRIGAVCLGPGFGTGAREAGLVAAALGAPVPGWTRDLSASGRVGGGGGPGSSPGRGLVLDADALTILSREAALFGALHGGCVLTPHGGEFARLFPDIAEKLAAPAVAGPAYSKVDATREAAVRAGCVVLFKGADTVIAAPDGRCAVNSAHYERAAPWLATAGSGDVLAGFIAGLMSRGFAPFDAACTGAWLHVECAREFGPGLIAEDLPEMLPAVFRRLGV